jgi:hypothetical protein
MRDFNHTVNVLVKAYLNSELRHGDCEACAVGNIVHAAGFPRYNAGKMPHDSCGMWKGVFYTDVDAQYFQPTAGPLYNNGIQMIQATGYTVLELARVEYAFETAPQGDSNDDWMFNGLMAVLEVLAEIHGVDFSTKETAKSLFVKP